MLSTDYGHAFAAFGNGHAEAREGAAWTAIRK